MPPNPNCTRTRNRVNRFSEARIVHLGFINLLLYFDSIVNVPAPQWGAPGLPPGGQLLGWMANPALLAGFFDAEGSCVVRGNSLTLAFFQSNPALLATIRLVVFGGAQPWARLRRRTPHNISNEGEKSRGNRR